MLSRNGTLLYNYLLNVTFRDQFDQAIYFDRNGDPPAWYDILNYVGFANPDQPYVEVKISLFYGLKEKTYSRLERIVR